MILKNHDNIGLRIYERSEENNNDYNIPSASRLFTASTNFPLSDEVCFYSLESCFFFLVEGSGRGQKKHNFLFWKLCKKYKTNVQKNNQS